MTSSSNLDLLTPEQLRALAAQLLSQVDTLGKTVETMGKKIDRDQTVIEQLTHEIAWFKRHSLDPATGLGSGKPHDPEKKRLSEIIEALNDIFGAEVSDEDQLQFLTGIANRISRQEDVMAQVNNHSVEQVMHGLFPKRVLDTVLDAMTDHEKLSLEVLDNETKSRAFALVILKMLTQQAGLGQGNSGTAV